MIDDNEQGKRAAAQETVREMIEGQRAMMPRFVTAALSIIDRPGFPTSMRASDRAMLTEVVKSIRQQYRLENGLTSVSWATLSWATLLAGVSTGERRVLEAHRALKRRR